MILTLDELKRIMPKCNAEQWKTPLNDAMDEFNINTPKRAAMFLAQIAHESGEFKFLQENLNYSAVALQKVFRKYFSTKEQALKYARQPQKIASKVYANRMGNGDENGQEGWKYRGRGLIQLTGKTNYTLASKYLNIDLLKNPEYLITEEGATRSAAWFFSTQTPCLKHADVKNLRACTICINGGTNGLEERTKYYDVACKVFGC